MSVFFKTITNFEFSDINEKHYEQIDQHKILCEHYCEDCDYYTTATMNETIQVGNCLEASCDGKNIAYKTEKLILVFKKSVFLILVLILAEYFNRRKRNECLESCSKCHAYKFAVKVYDCEKTDCISKLHIKYIKWL